jgi:hypothetical protein
MSKLCSVNPFQAVIKSGTSPSLRQLNGESSGIIRLGLAGVWERMTATAVPLGSAMAGLPLCGV